MTGCFRPRADIAYHPDRGPLGSLSNAQARTLLTGAFQEWASLGILNFTEGPLLAENINATDIPATNTAHYKHLWRVDGDGRSPVMFDTDGAIIDDLFGEDARLDILGVTGLDTPISSTPLIFEASIIINGAFFDGIGLPASPEDLPSQTAFQAVMVHEIGHFLNLDHSVLNLDLASDGLPGSDIFLPTMLPITAENEEPLVTLNPDDVAAFRGIYDTGATIGIGGSVLEGGSPFQGAHVVLRRVGNPLMMAYSTISGGLYFPCNPGTLCDPCSAGPCAPDPPEQGEYAVPFMAAGSYRVCALRGPSRSVCTTTVPGVPAHGGILATCTSWHHGWLPRAE